MSNEAPPQLQAIVPVLRFREVVAAIGIFELLEFKILAAFGDPANHAWMTRDAYQIKLVENPHAMPGHLGLYLQTDNIEVEWKRCCERGFRMLAPISDQPSGCREFAVEGPEKMRIEFGQPLHLRVDTAHFYKL